MQSCRVSKAEFYLYQTVVKLGVGMMKFLEPLNLKVFENSFNEDKSIRNNMHKKGLRFQPVLELVKLEFTCITIKK